MLGLVWERGPCTTYQVRKVFLASDNPSWSGSVGSIYPLVSRLERKGLLKSEPSGQGRRRSRHYTLTKNGLRSLRNWLDCGEDPVVTGVPPDPLRTRVLFLSALPPSRRKAFLELAREGVESRLAGYGERLANGEHDLANELVYQGAQEGQAARLRWIDAVLTRVLEDK